MKDNIKDREFDKFRSGQNGLSRVAVVLEQTTPIPVDTEGLNWTSVQASYPTNTQEVYEFFQDSDLVQTITINYVSASKKQIQSVTKVDHEL
jgi:hypothetical protein